MYEIKNKLDSALKSITPDVFDNIEKCMDTKEIYIMKQPTNNILKTGSIAASLVLLLGASVFAYDANFKTKSIVSLDVNPSIEIKLNKNNDIVDVDGVNDFADDIIDDLNVEKLPLNEAINEITNALIKNNFLTNDGQLLISVQSSNPEIAAVLSDELTANLNTTLSNTNIEILTQVVEKDKALADFAKTNNISIGKATFVSKIAEKDDTLTKEQLANLPIADIQTIVTDRKIDISDIVDFEDYNEELANVKNAEERLDQLLKNPNATPEQIADARKYLAYALAELDEESLEIYEDINDKDDDIDDDKDDINDDKDDIDDAFDDIDDDKDDIDDAFDDINDDKDDIDDDFNDINDDKNDIDDDFDDINDDKDDIDDDIDDDFDDHDDNDNDND